MIKFYSNIQPNKLLHIVYKLEDFKPDREDIIEPENWLQCSALQMGRGKTFKPHKHIWKDVIERKIAQESWHVVKGSVKCIFYDLDNTILDEYILYAGDTSFTLEGGHNYEILENNTLVLEFKTGPYMGQQLDKEFI